MRREYVRKGWIILSDGRPWDDWVYPTESAARETAERCGVPSFTITEGHRQGYIDPKTKEQVSEKMLFDKKRDR